MLGLSIGLGIGTQNVASGAAATTTWDTVGSDASYTYTNGNKTATKASSSGVDDIVKAVLGKSTAGNFQVTVTSTAGHDQVGFVKSTTTVTGTFVGTSGTIGYQADGTILFNGSAVQTALATYTTADVIKPSYDGTNVTFFKNGTQVGTAVNVSSVMTTLYPACNGKDIGDAFAADFTNWG